MAKKMSMSMRPKGVRNAADPPISMESGYDRSAMNKALGKLMKPKRGNRGKKNQSY